MEESNAFPAAVSGGGNIIHCKYRQNPENNSPVKSWLLWARKYLRLGHWRESKVVSKKSNPLFFFSPRVAEYLKSITAMISAHQLIWGTLEQRSCGWNLVPSTAGKNSLKFEEVEISLNKSSCRDILWPRFGLSDSKSSILQIKQMYSGSMAWATTFYIPSTTQAVHVLLQSESPWRQKSQTLLMGLNASNNLNFAWRVIVEDCVPFVEIKTLTLFLGLSFSGLFLFAYVISTDIQPQT